MKKRAGSAGVSRGAALLGSGIISSGLEFGRDQKRLVEVKQVLRSNKYIREVEVLQELHQLKKGEEYSFVF